VMVSSFLVGMLHNLRLGLIMLAIPPALYVSAILYFYVVDTCTELYERFSERSRGPAETLWTRQSNTDDIEARGIKDGELSVA
jgi:hypothetical protein